MAAPPASSRTYPLNWPRWAGRFLKLASRWVRLKVYGLPEMRSVAPAIFTLWHQDDLGLLPHFSFTNSTILVSASKDGEALGQAIETMSYRYVSGSSSRGAVGGILALKRVLDGGGNIVIAADGPRGPRQVAKPGAAFLAAKTGRPIYPLAMAVDRALTFHKSWNKTRLPWPFAKVVVVFGPPLHLPPEAARWPAHRQSRLVGAAIDDAARSAQKRLAAWRRNPLFSKL